MMRSIAALATVLLLAACGGGGSDAGDDSTEDAQKSRYSTLSESDLEAALLSLDDLPSGWSKDKDDGDSEGGDDEEGDLHVVKGNAACKTLIEDQDEGEIDSDDVSFTRGDVAPGLGEEIFTLKKGAAAKGFDELRTALKGCTSFASDLDESNPVLKITPKSAPDLGDDSLAFTFTTRIPDGPLFTARALAVGVGDNVVTLTDYGFAGMALSDAEFEKLAAKAVVKVEKKASTGSAA